MQNLNAARLTQVIETAFNRTSSVRWQMAIVRAQQEIEENPYLHWDGTELLVLSPVSQEIYRTTDSCRCRAAQFHQPCWHRAAQRLLTRYDEAQATN